MQLATSSVQRVDLTCNFEPASATWQSAMQRATGADTAARSPGAAVPDSVAQRTCDPHPGTDSRNNGTDTRNNGTDTRNNGTDTRNNGTDT